MENMLNMIDICKEIKPGFMNSVLLYSPSKDTYETVFIIKDFSYKLEKLTNAPYANIRASIEENDNAIGLIYMIMFGEIKGGIYHSWFDKAIQEDELVHLINQESLTYFLVNEKNKPVDILSIPNIVNEIALKYLIEEDAFWSNEEFNKLIIGTTNKYKSRERLWNHIA